MSLHDKKNILSHLARKAEEGTSELKALQKEADKIKAVLESENQYDLIVTQIELLDTIAYRVHESAISIYKNLLARLKTTELTHAEHEYYPANYLERFQNKNTLIVKILEAISNIRYHQPDALMDICFEYSIHEDEKVRKQAIQTLEVLAKYDLYIFYGDGKSWKGLGWEPQEKR